MSFIYNPSVGGGGGTPGGANTEIQFNNAGAFGGTTGLHWLSGSSEFQFDDNIIASFGTGSDATLKYDGSNFILNPKSVGSGILYVGDGSTGANIKAGFLGLADSVVNSARVLDMDCSSATILRGLSSVIEHTGGTSAMRAMLFTAIHSGSSTTAAKAPIGSLITSSLGTDTTGSITVLGTLTTAGSNVALATTGGTGQSVVFANRFAVSSAAGNTTDSKINAMSVHGQKPGAFTGAVGIVNRWAGLFSGTLQVNSNEKFVLEGSDTEIGDTYLTYASASSRVETYIDAARVKDEYSTYTDLNTPPQNYGISRGCVLALQQFWSY